MTSLWLAQQLGVGRDHRPQVATPTASCGEVIASDATMVVRFQPMARMGAAATKETFIMASVCELCGKKPSFGMNVSHSHRRTKRRWNPNIQRVRALVGGTPTRINVCTGLHPLGQGHQARSPQRPAPSLELVLQAPRFERLVRVASSSLVARRPGRS